VRSQVAKHPAVDKSEKMVLLLLKIFKILSRKQDNRIGFGEAGMRVVIKFLENPKTSKIAGEVRLGRSGRNLFWKQTDLTIIMNTGINAVQYPLKGS
jgi:hypothetical protein